MYARNIAVCFLVVIISLASLDSAEAQTPVWAKVSNEQIAAAKKLGVPVAFENSVGMQFVLIPPGTFLMGERDSAAEVAKKCALPSAQSGWFADEYPQHKVTLTAAFYMTTTEVTQASYETVIKSKVSTEYPEGFQGANHPVVNIAYRDVEKFFKTLGSREEEKACVYSVPSEAQWEYACRGGTQTPFSFGETISTDQANYNGEYIYGEGKKGLNREKPLPVGSLQPNDWGLYDMHGNVSEWCADFFGKYTRGAQSDPTGPEEGKLLVLRGSSWRSYPGACRSAFRVGCASNRRSYNVGVRAVCALPAKGE